DIRLHGNPAGEGTFKYVMIFFFISVFVLLIACMNFMNLSTARAATRALEVGVRKVVGAQLHHLVRQFLGEALLVCLIATIIGLGIAELLLPSFNEITDISLTIPWAEPELWLGLVGFVFIITLLAGMYPAFFLARFEPIEVLKTKSIMNNRGSWLRKGLVTFQFVVSVSLIVCTLIIAKQQNYLLSRSLGFEKENILYVHLKDNKVKEGLQTFKQKLLQQPSIKAVSGSNWVPGTTFITTMPAELQSESGKMESFNGSVMYVDYDFLDVMNIQNAEGRFFSRDFSTDTREKFLINQKSMEKTGLSPIDKQARIYYGEYGEIIFEKKGTVIGVLEDFHYYDLHREVGPVLITLSDPADHLQNFSACLIRTRSGDTRETVASIQKIWEETFPSRPFELEFASNKLEQAYQTEMKLGGIVSAFTFFAIFIACLGLLGLAAFTAQQRTKEIGIRKVLGANTSSILILLNKEFTCLVVVSLLIAFPLSYFMMEYWLQEYPYKIDFSVLPYGVAFGITLLITWLTVGGLALRSALSNPVEALRYE
ncbi:MAG: FtsX-like permease family protein, partial [Bacteroidetes bacterium]|nr:FtsX-like permease family protein [Bacteroidota bacterium]